MTTAEKTVEDGKNAGENVSAMRNLRPAVSHYEVVKDDGETSLVKLYIETGRTHQIRVHMASIGHPLVGDPIYGNGPELGMERTALHASELRWEKPHSGEVCCVKAELPEEIIVGCVYKKNRFIMQKHC